MVLMPPCSCTAEKQIYDGEARQEMGTIARPCVLMEFRSGTIRKDALMLL